MKTREIADFLSAELDGDGDIEIVGVADLASASPSQLAFATKDVPENRSHAGCVIVPLDSELITAGAVIKIADPKLAFSRIAEILHPQKPIAPGISSFALIAESATTGDNVFIGAFCSIGDGVRIGNNSQIRSGCSIAENVRIGENCLLHSNVVVEEGCVVGDNVILHAGVVIGTDGFGFVRDTDRYVKFPQLGTVIIENDVEIGANSCVDRGALGETRIGAGTKIDNLVQIAHNVQIGKRVIIAAQTGISGSSVIEDDCVIGGQVGIGDHVLIKSGAIIGSQAGVLPGKIVRAGIWWGTPVQPLAEYKRQNARVKGLERLKAEVTELKKTAKK